MAMAASLTVAPATEFLIFFTSSRATLIALNTRCGDTVRLKRVRGTFLTRLSWPRDNPATALAMPGMVLRATLTKWNGLRMLLSWALSMSSIEEGSVSTLIVLVLGAAV